MIWERRDPKAELLRASTTGRKQTRKCPLELTGRQGSSLEHFALRRLQKVKEQRRVGRGGLVQSAFCDDRRAGKNWSEARGAKYLKSQFCKIPEVPNSVIF